MMALLTLQHRVSGSEVPLDWEHRVKHDGFAYTAKQSIGQCGTPGLGKLGKT